jgi:glycerol uptake facilitator-like aquaporin
MSQEVLDIEQNARQKHIELIPSGGTMQTSEQINADIQIKIDDAKHKRNINLMLTSSGLFLIVSGFLFCIWVLVKSDSVEDKKLAFGMLIGIITGFLGYITGKTSKD